MNASPKFQRKVLLNLTKALADEDAHLRKFANLAHGAAFSGAVLICIAAFFYSSAASGAWVIAASAAGGCLIGLSIFFRSSVDQWPVMRRFLDARAVQDAAVKEGLVQRSKGEEK